MGKHDPERDARWMRDTEPVSDHYQFAAVGQRDCGRQRAAIKEKRDEKYCTSAEQLCPKPWDSLFVPLAGRF